MAEYHVFCNTLQVSTSVCKVDHSNDNSNDLKFNKRNCPLAQVNTEKATFRAIINSIYGKETCKIDFVSVMSGCYIVNFNNVSLVGIIPFFPVS